MGSRSYKAKYWCFFLSSLSFRKDKDKTGKFISCVVKVEGFESMHKNSI